MSSRILNERYCRAGEFAGSEARAEGSCSLPSTTALTHHACSRSGAAFVSRKSVVFVIGSGLSRAAAPPAVER